MSAYIPSNTEVRALMLDALGEDIMDSVPMREYILSQRPTWVVSKKRIRRLLNTPPTPNTNEAQSTPDECGPNVVTADVLLVLPDQDGASNPLDSLSSLQDRVRATEIEVDGRGQLKGEDLRSIFHGKEIECIREMYDRRGTINEWYYAVFAVTRVKESETADRNSIATFLKKNGDGVVFGPAIVVRDGPEETRAERLADPGITADDFSRTVWWYVRSGRDISEVYGERELTRHLLGVFNSGA
ncbi:hypothetical protein BV25DRAFT_1912312 [Artomyces pyxidatus]|uniref:Uncharacterized protein n=1 Tax=Artomyces pyxidatus TaxID=48021 RepID=A0ACB8TEX7_9AGAM|nr:hypothetical protein BV25DRAFT_1912312 [Artomyces pyxidatus]